MTTVRGRSACSIIIIIIQCIFSFVIIGRESTMWSANNCLQIMIYSCALTSVSDFAANNICSCACVVVSTSEKNGSSFSRDEEEWLDLSTRPEKTAKPQRRQWKFLLLYFSNIWKIENWIKTSSYYQRQSYAFICINSARNIAVST